MKKTFLSVSAELECVSHPRANLACGDFGFCSLMSEHELTGGSLWAVESAWSLTPFVSDHEDRQVEVRSDRSFAHLGLESDLQQLLTLGPSNVGLNAAETNTYGLGFHANSSDSGKLDESTMNVVKDPGADAGSKAGKTIGRRKKKNKKYVAELVYGDKASVASSSEGSIADEEIEHRNSIIRKEAEATWEVSQIMGISFDCEKNKLLQVFMDLEQTELERKGSRA